MAIKGSKFNLVDFDFEENVDDDAKYCKKCKAKNVKTAKFCNECGNNTFYLSKQELDELDNFKYCIKCQTKLDINSKFCHNCGGNEFCQSKDELEKQSSLKYQAEFEQLQSTYEFYDNKRKELLEKKSYYETNIKDLTENSIHNKTITKLKNEIDDLKEKLDGFSNSNFKSTANDDIVKAIFDDAVEVGSVESKKSFEDGVELYNKQQYTLALKKFLEASKCGSHDANNYLGYMYSFGFGVEQDKELAVKYYLKAIEGGNMHACANLASMYYYGDGVDLDYEKAFFYNQEGAKLGNSVCYNSLGWMYQYGQGVSVNYAKAKENYEKAAEMGNYYAFDNIFYAYFRGDIIPDYRTVMKWIKKGIKLGYANSYYHLACTYRYGCDEDRDDRKAFDNFYIAAGKGHPEALFELGIAYKYGEMGLNVNEDHANTYFKLAAERGHQGAKSHLGE